MNISRRAVAKTIILLISVPTLFLSGCSTVQDILAWAPVGQKAFNALVDLLQKYNLTNPTVDKFIADAQTGFTDLIADAQAYASANPPPTGALAKLQEALSLLAGNIQSALANLTGNTSTIIELIVGLAQLILGVIEGFENSLPPSPTSSMHHKKGIFKIRQRFVNYSPLKISASQFTSRWNKLCSDQGQAQAEIK